VHFPLPRGKTILFEEDRKVVRNKNKKDLTLFGRNCIREMVDLYKKKRKKREKKLSM